MKTRIQLATLLAMTIAAVFAVANHFGSMGISPEILRFSRWAVIAALLAYATVYESR